MKSWNIAVTWIFRTSNSSSVDLPFLFGMFLHLACSPPVLSSTVWTGVGRTHLPGLYKLKQVAIISEWNQTGRFNHLPPELRGRVASILHKMEGFFGTTRTLPTSGHITKLSKLGKRIVIRNVTKNPMAEPWPQMGEHSRRSIITLFGLHSKCPFSEAKQVLFIACTITSMVVAALGFSAAEMGQLVKVKRNQIQGKA